ncbi:MAG: hypothetical protein K2N43_08535 [Lachnospiraceae bacterium]|nr:hypothetical protein [Lachnospiraceae bacterium]
MPLPLILGIGAAVAGLAGVGSGVHGAVKMKEANDTMKSVDARHKNNLKRFEEQSRTTNADMDKIGQLELEILKSFEQFSEVFAKIKNKPEFKPYEKDDFSIPQYSGEKLKEVSIGAGVLLGGIGGAAAGTAGGFAAAGATTAAVMALGTASTGTAIASLSGAAATNATLAALGGGALAAGGGGIALGTTILGATTLGVGLLVGGVIFNFTGASLSNKADEAHAQMERAEKEIDRSCKYMKELSKTANCYRGSLRTVNDVYVRHLHYLQQLVYGQKKTDWFDFTAEERLSTENTSLLVGLLYKMCKVQMVLKADNNNEINSVNHKELNEAMHSAEKFLKNRGLSKEEEEYGGE